MTTYAYLDTLMKRAHVELDRLRERYPDDQGLKIVTLHWGKNMTRVAGRARYILHSEEDRAEVHMSQHMFRQYENADGFIATLHHELAHISVTIATRRDQAHNAVWKARAMQFGGSVAAEQYHCLARTQKRMKRVEVVCCKCDAKLNMTVRRAKSLLRGQNVYTHNNCGGLIKLF